MRAATRLLVLGVLIFAAAFATRWLFFWDVKPISWDQEPPQNGALEAAFLLLSIENVAAVVAAIALAVIAALWVRRRWRAGSPSPGF